jgi:spore maturation protein CgeB
MNTLILINKSYFKDFTYSNGYNEIYKPILYSKIFKKVDYYIYEQEYHKLEQKIIDKYKNMKLGVYPCGRYLQKYYKNYFKQLNIKFFIDDSKQTFYNHKVIKIENLPDDCNNILITSEHTEFFYKKIKKIKPNLNILNNKPIFEEKIIYKKYNNILKQNLTLMIENNKPDIIFVSMPYDIKKLIEHNILIQLKNKYKFKIVYVLWDFDENNPLLTKAEKEISKYADFIIENSSKTRVDKIRKRKGIYKNYPKVENFYFHPTIFDPQIYKKRNLKKIYDISIFGNLEGVRKNYAKFLKKEFKGKFFHHGGYSISTKNYVKKLNQTKIFVNTQTFPSYRIQCKGKIREALMCGVFILEEDNAETRSFIKEGNGIIYFKNKFDLKKKINYYLKYPKKREFIAKKGYIFAKKHLTPKKWVKFILKSLYKETKC